MSTDMSDDPAIDLGTLSLPGSLDTSADRERGHASSNSLSTSTRMNSGQILMGPFGVVVESRNRDSLHLQTSRRYRKLMPDIPSCL
jgi:hypothetical protein